MKKAKEKKPVSTLGLPMTYRQLFSFTYKTNWMLIMKVSLMVALFALPFMAAVLFKGILESAIASVDTLSQEEINTRIMAFRGLYGFVLVVGLLILSIGLAGAIYVMDRFLRNEGASFKRDFFKGIKRNAGHYLLLTLFYGLLLGLFNFLLNLPSFKEYYSLMLVVFVIVSTLIVSAYFISLVMANNYKVGFFSNIKNAFLAVMSFLPYILLMLAGSILPMVICYLIPVALVQFIGWLVYICIGFGQAVLMVTIVSLRIFDESVNKRQFPEIYRKGLFKPEDNAIGDEGFSK